MILRQKTLTHLAQNFCITQNNRVVQHNLIDLFKIRPNWHGPQGPGSSTFAFTAAKLWNALPANIQRIDTPGSFRRAVLMFLVRKYESYDSNPFLYS